MLAGRCVEKGYIELSRTELGLTLDSRSATLELSALRLGIALGACHTPTESCVVSHLLKIGYVLLNAIKMAIVSTEVTY